MFSKILIGFEGSDACKRAFAVGLDLAKQYKSTLLVCSVIEDLQRYAEEAISEIEDLMAQAKKHFESAQKPLVEEAERAGVKVTSHVLPGHPVETLVQLADHEKVDCIVLGGLGHPHLIRRAGTGAQIAYHAQCSVLIAR